MLRRAAPTSCAERSPTKAKVVTGGPVTEKKREPTQKTRPKKGKPVEIPVPTRKEVFDLIEGVSGKRPSSADDRRPKQ